MKPNQTNPNQGLNRLNAIAPNQTNPNQRLNRPNAIKLD